VSPEVDKEEQRLQKMAAMDEAFRVEQRRRLVRDTHISSKEIYPQDLPLLLYTQPDGPFLSMIGTDLFRANAWIRSWDDIQNGKRDELHVSKQAEVHAKRIEETWMPKWPSLKYAVFPRLRYLYAYTEFWKQHMAEEAAKRPQTPVKELRIPASPDISQEYYATTGRRPVPPSPPAAVRRTKGVYTKRQRELNSVERTDPISSSPDSPPFSLRQQRPVKRRLTLKQVVPETKSKPATATAVVAEEPEPLLLLSQSSSEFTCLKCGKGANSQCQCGDWILEPHEEPPTAATLEALKGLQQSLDTLPPLPYS
jgi:hypothetical protein